jgi:hypothetical protein
MSNLSQLFSSFLSFLAIKQSPEKVMNVAMKIPHQKNLCFKK